MKRPAAAGQAPAPASAPVAMIEVRGRVVDPQGRPVPGATVQAVYIGVNQHIEPAPGSTRAGRPVPAAVPLGDFPDSCSPMPCGRGGILPWIVAFGPGIRAGQGRGLAKAGASGELTIRLVEAGPPIEGRIVDLEGRPVAGARIKVERLWFPSEGTLADWLAGAADRNPHNPWQGLDLLPMTTDLDRHHHGP